MSGALLIYGSYGYTGRLIVEEALAGGLRPILAGRRADVLAAQAQEAGLPCRPVGLDDPAKLDAALEGVAVVLHCAGPFSRTSKPMVEACLRRRVHYLDVTGEIEVFERIARRDAEAQAAGVVLLPGVGFDVVPSDCLAAHLKARLPTATHLELAFQGSGTTSHGTTTTMLENLHRGGAIRRDGRIVPVPALHRTRRIDFGRGPRMAGTIPWGDVSTAFHSTGIPNIAVFMAMPRALRLALRASRLLGPVLALPKVQAFLQARVDAAPAGPSPDARARGRSLLWGEATDSQGHVAVSRLETPDGYTLTAQAAVLIATRVLAGEVKAGFQTPSRAFGADFVLSLPGVMRTDVR